MYLVGFAVLSLRSLAQDLTQKKQKKRLALGQILPLPLEQLLQIAASPSPLF